MKGCGLVNLPLGFAYDFPPHLCRTSSMLDRIGLQGCSRGDVKFRQSIPEYGIVVLLKGLLSYIIRAVREF